jgi:hypothetical protein
VSSGSERSPRARIAVALLLAGAAVALLFAAAAPRDQRIVFEDEHQFLRGAANLARHGRLDFGDPASDRRAHPLLREPGYPAALALAWRLAGTTAPESSAAIDRMHERPELWRAIRALHLLCLGLAAVASGWAVAQLEGNVLGALAALLVAASPELQRSGTLAMSESLSAALLAAFAAGLVGVAVDRDRAGLAWLVPAAVLLPLVRAEGALLLPLAAFALATTGLPERPRQRTARFALALVLLALPTMLWLARNRGVSGELVLSDRGGLALAVRAALDEDVARFGARAAALAFTPSVSARRLASELAPDSTLLDQRPEGSENFLLRTYREIEAARAVPGADPLAVDRQFGRAALRQFAHRPLEHLVAAIVVAWRGLFAERSPAFAHPFDLSLPLGLLLGGSAVTLFLWACLRRDTGRLALLAPAAILVAFHLAATEFLPRYAVAMLPLSWASFVVLLGVFRRERAA